MLRKSFLLRAGLIVLALSAIQARSQQTTLPEAPKPSDPANNTPAAIEKRKWSDVIEPGEKVAPLYVKQKLLFPLHEEIRLTGFIPTFFSSGWEHLRDTDPRFGVDSGAYGQRLGAAALRDFSMRFFSDGVLPAVTHEDPRYYRMAEGPKMHRGLYAVSRVFVTPTDSGKTHFNTSGILGRGMASALTMAYYPDRSAKADVVFQTWGYSLLGEAGGLLWSEFWPDLRNKIFHHNTDNQH